MDLHHVDLSFIPTKSNHLEVFFLRGISLFKIPLHRITHATLAGVKRGGCCGRAYDG